MPSPKLRASIAGRAYVAPTRSSPAANTRFSVVPANDPDLARVQEDLRASGDGAVGSNPFKHGQLIDVDFNEGLEQTIPHQLGGPAPGFIVVDIGGLAAVVMRDDTTTAFPINEARADSHIKLRASSACRAKVWVWR